MKKLIWVGLLAAAFYGHSRFVFSEPALMSWIQKQQQMDMHASDGFCDAYADDFAFEMRTRTPRGEMTVQGGKDEICEYIRDANAAMLVTQPSLSINTELLDVQRSGFPWLKATATVRQISTLRLRGAPAMTEVSESTMVLRRTFKGREFVSIDSDGTAAIE